MSLLAQNGSNSESDLPSIQDEIPQRLDEINRISISAQTGFNGVKILSKDQSVGICLSKIDVTTLKMNTFDITRPVPRYWLRPTGLLRTYCPC
ncbi:flagellin N-terminal helical domain-containing protein [Edwardsiella ictaluri]|uniref:flagellin N-terminal helical domain-containing protein n=1 Tax=Edwardsiella ictaluri TaxID=67780 RepID=UPI00065DB717|nr:hypothetical protein ABY58_10235 [Edwardsiella ictaluri]KOO55011.1 hypothetical protein ACS33_10150 [Edwardsiella ictaluri]BEH99389.1 hypothetical protein KH20906_21170 [Edwardsiella ictaluri]BEI02878.1 hypothetical protein KB20921_21390 [Edwardsiella ictaluri]BEI06339.1 hypothetical protein KH201010_21250 [Edwardsiella ictaluri]